MGSKLCLVGRPYNRPTRLSERWRGGGGRREGGVDHKPPEVSAGGSLPPVRPAFLVCFRTRRHGWSTGAGRTAFTEAGYDSSRAYARPSSGKGSIDDINSRTW